MKIFDINKIITVDSLIKKHGYAEITSSLVAHSDTLIFDITLLRDKLSDIKMMIDIERNTDELRHLRYSHEEVQSSIKDKLHDLDRTHLLIAESTSTQLKA